MVLINIENLSDTELGYIAKQEQIDDWEKLDREELIYAIRDIYDEENKINPAGSDCYKFIKGITDINSDFLQLPGVDPLPEAYNETSVHLVLRDYNWAFAFWSISINTTKKLEESGSALKLRLESSSDSYEIEISLTDSTWNIELPWKEETYRLLLISTTDGKDSVIAKSNEIKLSSIYLSNHSEELKNESAYKVLVQPMISKEGAVINNKQVKEILQATGEVNE